MDYIREGRNPPKNLFEDVCTALLEYIEESQTQPSTQILLDELRKLAADTKVRDTVADEKLTAIKNRSHIENVSNTKMDYVKVARNMVNNRFTYSTSTSTLPPSIHPSRRYEVIVQLGTDEAKQAVAKTSQEELTRLVNESVRKTLNTDKDIRMAKRLPKSGDVAVATANEEEMKRLKENVLWMNNIWSKARVRTKTYGVMLHGVNVHSLDLKDLPTAIEHVRLRNQHAVLLDIAWMGWYRHLKTGDRTAPLVIECMTAEQANRACDRGVLIGSEVHACHPYNSACRTRQCFQCWGYGHYQTSCSKKGRLTCGKCSEEHHHSECPQHHSKKCANCSGRHEAWSRQCELMQGELKRVRTEVAMTPLRYPVEVVEEAKTSPPSTLEQQDPMLSNVIGLKRPSSRLSGPSTRGGQPARGGGMRGSRVSILTSNDSKRRSTSPAKGAIALERRSLRTHTPSQAAFDARKLDKELDEGIYTNQEGDHPFQEVNGNKGRRKAVTSNDNMNKRVIMTDENRFSQLEEDDSEHIPLQDIDHGHLQQSVMDDEF